MSANAKLQEQLTEYFVRTREAGRSGGRSSGARPVAIVPDTVEYREDHETRRPAPEFNGAASRFSANGFAGWGHGAPEPVAENFPLQGGAIRGHRDLSNMANGSVGPYSVRDRSRDAVALATGGAIAWSLLSWAAENKADAIGWTGLAGIIVDAWWYPWIAKTAAMVWPF